MSEVEEATGVPETEVAEHAIPTMDDLFAIASDTAQEDKDAAKLLDKPGTYTSIPDMGVSIDVNKSERTIVTVFGQGVNEKTGDKARLRFRFSYQPGYKDDGSTPDWNYSNYLKAKNAFKVTFGMAAENPGVIVEYLQKFPAKFTLVQVGIQKYDKQGNPVGDPPTGEPGTLIVGVLGIKQ